MKLKGSSNPCLNGGLCTSVGVTQFTCTWYFLESKYYYYYYYYYFSPIFNINFFNTSYNGYSGSHCEVSPILSNPCSNTPCYNGGTCVPVINGFSCNCRAGTKNLNTDLYYLSKYTLQYIVFNLEKDIREENTFFQLNFINYVHLLLGYGGARCLSRIGINSNNDNANVISPELSTATSTLSQSECVDSQSSCITWSTMGLCDFINKKDQNLCRKSCGLC